MERNAPFPMDRPDGIPATAPRNPRRVLLVGPLGSERRPANEAAHTFSALADALEREPSLDVDRSDVSAEDVADRILAPDSRFDAVMLNVSPADLRCAGDAVRAACRSAQTPLIVRVFGGGLERLEGSASTAECVLLETRALCEHFEETEHAGRIRQWPTTRDLPARQQPLPSRARRFVVVDRSGEQDGIRDAIEAAGRLPADAKLTVVKAESEDDVRRLLAEHDVLVFPACEAGAGMPGTVVEAMQTGLPVVATRWRAIPELVEDGENGLLAAPHNVDGLAAAMRRIAESDDLFRRLQAGAQRTGERFRARHWRPRLVRWIHDLASGKPSSATC
ncbi:MAG: glycosyltransferase family 4 protein [Planctomycetota bacterium]